jgi:hypothetical protein
MTGIYSNPMRRLKVPSYGPDSLWAFVDFHS